jgi:hypothetical protein
MASWERRWIGQVAVSTRGEMEARVSGPLDEATACRLAWSMVGRVALLAGRCWIPGFLLHLLR